MEHTRTNTMAHQTPTPPGRFDATDLLDAALDSMGEPFRWEVRGTDVVLRVDFTRGHLEVIPRDALQCDLIVVDDGLVPDDLARVGRIVTQLASTRQVG
jgi:hypothetical protein